MVTIMVVWTVARVLRSHRNEPELRHPALGLFLLLVMQICLGAITIWSGRAVIPTTSHVLIGAAVLATSLTITIRAYHVYGIERHGGAAHAVSSPAREDRPLGHQVSA